LPLLIQTSYQNPLHMHASSLSVGSISTAEEPHTPKQAWNLPGYATHDSRFMLGGYDDLVGDVSRLNLAPSQNGNMPMSQNGKMNMSQNGHPNLPVSHNHSQHHRTHSGAGGSPIFGKSVFVENEDKFPILVRRPSSAVSPPLEETFQQQHHNHHGNHGSYNGNGSPPMHQPLTPPYEKAGGKFNCSTAANNNNSHSVMQAIPASPLTPNLHTNLSPTFVGSNNHYRRASQPASSCIPPAFTPERSPNGTASSGVQTPSTTSSKISSIDLNNCDIFALCKDQHGCRYLQRKLEEEPYYLNLIFEQTHSHVVELMTDPFGNYLCQKLLENCSVAQTTVLIRTAAPSLVQVALNQHGTRALQKMIDYVTNDEQIEIIVQALERNVVRLIQDLNGNHVIQKCLNRLNSCDTNFIYRAVSQNLVVVATHRHGCCVLQRCVDYADVLQREMLIGVITKHALQLVCDPFGNYVTQYVLGEQVIRQFVGHVVALSMQKFSSNVIEKSLKVASYELRAVLIAEICASPLLPKLLSDCYGNYVVQTALDTANQYTRAQLIDRIRPVLPMIRQTPYGRRIQAKVDARVFYY
jgi:hypothetical protein